MQQTQNPSAEIRRKSHEDGAICRTCCIPYMHELEMLPANIWTNLGNISKYDNPYIYGCHIFSAFRFVPMCIFWSVTRFNQHLILALRVYWPCPLLLFYVGPICNCKTRKCSIDFQMPNFLILLIYSQHIKYIYLPVTEQDLGVMTRRESRRRVWRHWGSPRKGSEWTQSSVSNHPPRGMVGKTPPI